MRVLHVFKTYPPDAFGGVERVIWQIAEGTRAYGTQSTVFFLSSKQHGPGRLANHATYGAHLDIYVASTGLSASAFRAFRKLAAEHDIIHYHFPWPMMDLLELSFRHGKPRIVTYHSDIVRQRILGRVYAGLMNMFLGRVERIIATSPHYLQSSLVLDRYKDKCHVVPIGIAEGESVDPEVLAAWRSRVGSDFFLFVGALRYYKGLPFLIEAARLSGLPVVVAGEGEMAAELAGAGLANLKAVGAVAEVDKLALLSLCRAFVFPSHLRSEAFGVALLEAARAGKPMISCEMGTGTSFVNLNGVTGFVVPPGESRELARAMQQLWANPAQAGGMGAAARKRYLELFTSQAMAKAYQQHYEELLVDKRLGDGTAQKRGAE